MTTFQQRQWMMNADDSNMKLVTDGPEESAAFAVDLEDMPKLVDRREHRRFDVESWEVPVQRWDGRTGNGTVFGKILDMSAGGMRLRTRQSGIVPDQQIRVRVELPSQNGICPFVETAGGAPTPKREWIGWLAVSRVQRAGNNAFDIAGRLVDMEEMDRGMLGLYLSVQPMAA